MISRVPRFPFWSPSRLLSAAAVLGAFLLALALQGCLSGQGPTGSGAESHITEADKYLGKGQCAKAMTAYASAIAEDSTLSAAYRGYYKSTLCFYGISVSEILQDFALMEQSFSDTGMRFPFLDHDDETLTKRLQASSRVRLVLGRLVDRDTLTRWWRYLDATVTPEEAADTMYAARRAAMEHYLIQADLGVPGYRKAAQFPLTDGVVSYQDMLLEFTLFSITYSLTRLYDLEGNDTIDHRDAIMKNLQFGSGSGSGGFSIDSLSRIAGDLENDSAAARNLNELIRDMGNGTDSSSLLCLLVAGGCATPDSGSVPGGSPDIDGTIAGLGDAVLFYQFGDKLDNDGDGCVDEEILDDKDNDLDGYVDEDARVIPADKPDGVDNDRNGKKDPYFASSNADLLTVDSAEGPVGASVYPGRPHVLGFVHKFLKTTAAPADLGGAPNQLNLEADQTTWVKIKKNATPDALQLRLALQRDSLAVRIPVGGPVPDSLAAKLQHAKAIVGGCWRYYP